MLKEILKKGEQKLKNYIDKELLQILTLLLDKSTDIKLIIKLVKNTSIINQLKSISLIE